jgi:hypothetical protein
MRDCEGAPRASEAGPAGWALRLAWIAAYSFALLLALRFGARSYPGWYFPDSALLNRLLNGVGLFTVIGYDLVLLGAVAAAMRLLLGRGNRRAGLALAALQWGAIALAVLIACYGVAWAAYMHRLPWEPDGHGRLAFP